MSELGSTVKKSKKQSPSLKARALRLLSMREYSRKGLAAKLEESAARMLKFQTPAEDSEVLESVIPLTTQIEAVLDDFEARGWLSDQRFAEALVRRRSERFGTRKIQDELAQAGVDSAKTIDLLRNLKETEYQRAHDLWLRKFGALAIEQKERARQYRFLASKGFSSDVVSKVVAGRPD
ncbi:MAG: recombination regulator RecX [Polynucleobacter sp. 24-46-87]|uniref:recombination regulator RecX n=1 Tax=unclassified Polynucleobacter TaxID=2640945 RepID=UPI000BD3F0E0|nr:MULTISPECIES: recombination regulator RecX [unclassified Polynucleobacter]OYY12342.1 MAG: recombination regulator RecX [Polynucleobacter sp. 35-46-11]OZA07356.1 MAG: recombination regulator RecX [Polynucleobacter sp. 24-46-87]OZA73053.1 MAG: recombination regulator RecX [Polynucleobacter sp. 39-46-10]